jgi:hypothetical protein
MIANPLASKLSTVLATSYADSDFRDAVALLDQRSVRNTAETRRQLRLHVQKDVISSSAGVIQEFGQVADQLRRIGTVLGNLNATYKGMQASARSAHAATSEILDEASKLDRQRRQVGTRQLLLQRFRQQFVLSEDDVQCLTSAAEPVDGRFFAALARTKRISTDCEVLLGFEEQTLGRHIMDRTAKTLNQAYQKLYKWVRLEFSSLNLENPQIGSNIRHALRVLAERPSLFESCLETFSESREQTLSDAFFSALTGRDAGAAQDRSVKPIEIVAHDPLRYVGDMLAWTHSATVSEKESLEIFFVAEADEIAKGMQAGRETEFWRITEEHEEGAPAFDAIKALSNLVDRDTAGVARLLRQRVEQVVQASEESNLAYRLSNLLGFYRATFVKLVGTQSHLVATLASLESEALRLFRSLMRDRAAALEPDFQRIPAELACPGFLLDALEDLSVVIKTYETALSSGAEREAEVADILAVALDPFLLGCEKLVTRLEPPSSSIFRINYLSAARAKLSLHQPTARRASELDRVIADERIALVDSQYQFLRRSSGLDGLIEAAEETARRRKNVQPAHLRELDALQPQALAIAAQQLDEFLPSALMDALENLEGLQDPNLSMQITEKAAGGFCDDFEQIEQMLLAADDVDNYEKKGTTLGQEGDDGLQVLRALFPRTSAEIRVLLS